MRKARLLVENGVFFKEVVDLRTERLLQHISDRARSRGMKINAAKTSLVCISAATSFESRVRLELDGQTVRGQDQMKILGVTLDRDCTFRSHVDNLQRRLRARTWALSRLRKKGLSTDRLLRAYKCLIRPTVEYASPAWHSLLSAEQSDRIERQQIQALKNIYGPGLSASKMRSKADLPLLRTRREEITLKFAQKATTNKRCSGWFVERAAPKYARRASTNYPRYQEPTARTDRFRNSPINYMIRLLNKT